MKGLIKRLIILLIMTLVVIGSYLIVKGIIANKIDNSSWKLIGWNVNSLSPDITSITLNFNKNKIGGNGGVNSYGGDYEIGIHNDIRFNNMNANEMASIDPDINRAESAYFSLLKEVRYYQLDKTSLILLDINKNTLLIFEKK